MKIAFFRNLNKVETYATNKKQVKLNLPNKEDANVLFGLRRKFEFDTQCSRPPQISGTVVASVTCNRDKDISIYFYPISQNIYPEKAKSQFHNDVLPELKKWIEKQSSKPDTAVLGVEEYIIEWNGKNHLFHQIKFL
ncbi:hypothetical protein ACFCYN_23570 [Gottfriedia sp. NPDC056225]|uniref:hypothetical protein n=1 Tax=Gottfriedia sp. NPDC056225 TaxID=3345751 RepID=UPI001558DE64|nr:hypothetical protein HPK19_05355 [Arthrobacter citreus]